MLRMGKMVVVCMVLKVRNYGYVVGEIRRGIEMRGDVLASGRE